MPLGKFIVWHPDPDRNLTPETGENYLNFSAVAVAKFDSHGLCPWVRIFRLRLLAMNLLHQPDEGLVDLRSFGEIVQLWKPEA